MRTGARALTLLEIVVAVGLLAVAILSLMLLFGQNLRFLNQSEEMTRAHQVAEQMLEMSRTFGSIPMGRTFDGLADDPLDPATGYPPHPYPKVTIGERDYFVSVTTALHHGTRAVRVEVRWDQKEGGRTVLETSFPP